jgi:[ribosomal protein S5]-alanine N-acetyltransferase
MASSLERATPRTINLQGDPDMKPLRVYLRALEPDDYRTSYEWRQDPEIWAMVVGRRYFVSSEYEKRWVQEAIADSRNNVRLAICVRENDEYIGNIYLRDIDWFTRSASLAKLIGNKAYWGKGYATEATLLALRHAFYDLGLERVQARTLVTNAGSIRVDEKCGFRVEGTLRHAAFKDGAYRDLYLMAVLRQDFRQVAADYELLPEQPNASERPDPV